MSASSVSTFQAARLLRSSTVFAVFCRPAALPLALAGALILLLALSTPRPATRWKDVFIQAEIALSAGNPLAARGLYARAARAAASANDWRGALAAACGMKRIEGARGDYAVTRRMLVRAMMLAETGQSAAGLDAVAHAFAAIGEPAAASLARSRIAPGPGSEFTPTEFARTCL